MATHEVRVEPIKRENMATIIGHIVESEHPEAAILLGYVAASRMALAAAIKQGEDAETVEALTEAVQALDGEKIAVFHAN